MKKASTLLIFIFSLTAFNLHSQTWTALASGLGVSTESVKTVEVDPSGNIYAGGTFTGAINYIAKWPINGNAWEGLGAGVDGPVYAISAKTSSDIYVGGDFNNAGGSAAENIARWSGTTWTTLGSGLNGTVKCIFIENSLAAPVFAGGEFTLSGASSMNHIAKWSNNTWTTIGSGLNSIVNSIVENNSTLYSGTENLIDPVQKFDGTSWSSVSGISGGKVNALASFNNELYAGGEFSSPTRAAAKYDGTSWGTISTTFGSTDKINAMLVRSGVLYLGGKFSGLGVGSQASFISRKTTTNNPIQSITTLANSLNDEVYAIGYLNNKLIVGGKFTQSTIPLNHIAITNVTIDIDELSNIVVTKNFFPNPVISLAHLTLTTNIKLLKPELKIYDVQSRLVSTISNKEESHGNEINFTFDCTSYPKGNYYYILSENGKGVFSDPFIVE